jgi:hypothetical protein
LLNYHAKNVETASSTGFEEFNQISCVSPASDMINNDGKKVNGELNHPELTKKVRYTLFI